MHDPLVVALEIRRPWPRRSSGMPAGEKRWAWRPGSAFATLAGTAYYFPSLVTVWHREPGGHDAFEVCPAGGRWKWHVHHWKLQVPPMQALRRRLLTYCAWCGGRDAPRDRVNCSTGWQAERGPWWQGQRNLFHSSCSDMPAVWRMCTCETPLFAHDLAGSSYGDCANCGRHRGWRWTQEEIERARRMQQVPFGTRPERVP